MNEDTIKFLLWLEKDGTTLYMSDWRKHYIYLMYQFYAQFKGW